MVVDAEFILPEDRRWRDFLTTASHDCYHLPEYVRFAAKHEGGSPGAYYVENNGMALLVPVLRQALPKDLGGTGMACDFISPYGYPGPIFSGGTDAPNARELFAGFLDIARSQGAVAIFLRIHPLLQDFLSTMADFGELVMHGRTVFGEMSGGRDDIWSGLSGNHWRNIKKLQKSGFVSVHNDFAWWEGFIGVYLETMRRVGATRQYFFSRDYFDDLRQALGNRLHLWSVHSSQGALAAASIFIETDGIVQFHLGGTAAEFSSFAPAKLLMYDVGNWANAQNARFFHLGGGVGGREDSLFSYKSGFFKNYSNFYTLRIIADEPKYRQLTTIWKNNTLDSHCDLHFFPLYRQELS